MPQFELDEESVFRAQRLSSLMMNDLRIGANEDMAVEQRRQLFSSQRYSEEAGGVPISDVAANLERLSGDFILARRLNANLICRRLPEGHLAPISTSQVLSAYLPFSNSTQNFVEGVWREFVSAVSQSDLYRITDRAEAEASLERGLSWFLSYRFAGVRTIFTSARNRLRLNSLSELLRVIRDMLSVRERDRPRLGPEGSLRMVVSCRTPGLRIHVSPAYFVNWVFFGSPTTPVMSYVLPGRYIFAGDGPLLPNLTEDTGVFCVPPTFHAVLTRF